MSTKRFFLWVPVLLIAVGILLYSFIFRGCSGVLVPWEHPSEIVRVGTPVILALEEHREKSGGYPKSLLEVRPGWIALQTTKNGHEIRYYRDGSGYRLVVGGRYFEGIFEGPASKEWRPDLVLPESLRSANRPFSWNSWVFVRD